MISPTIAGFQSRDTFNAWWSTLNGNAGPVYTVPVRMVTKTTWDVFHSYMVQQPIIFGVST